jgi:hypothetical protein
MLLKEPEMSVFGTNRTSRAGLMMSEFGVDPEYGL